MSTREQITLTYAGRRLGKNSKVIHEWIHGDRELYFAKLVGSAIGGLYSVDADLDGDGVSVFQDTLRYTGEKIDDVEQVAVWQAADQSARTSAAERAAERRHSKSTELDEALAPVLRLIQRARTRSEAQAIARVVGDKLDEAWWKR